MSVLQKRNRGEEIIAAGSRMNGLLQDAADTLKTYL
jgi:hypothetical protein